MDNLSLFFYLDWRDFPTVRDSIQHLWYLCLWFMLCTRSCLIYRRCVWWFSLPRAFTEFQVHPVPSLRKTGYKQQEKPDPAPKKIRIRSRPEEKKRIHFNFILMLDPDSGVIQLLYNSGYGPNTRIRFWPKYQDPYQINTRIRPKMWIRIISEYPDLYSIKIPGF